MRVGLFGGTFDPIHRGHIVPVQQAKRALDLDQVLYLPTARPPHKRDRRFAPAHARHTMVELALLYEPDLLVSPYELTLQRPAYTVETVRHFQAVRPDDEFYLIVGADAFRELHLWHRWRELLALLPIVVLSRPGVDEQLEAPADEARAGRILRPENDFVAVSSTTLRACFEHGRRPPEELVPKAVIDYIEKYTLYR